VNTAAREKGVVIVTGASRGIGAAIAHGGRCRSDRPERQVKNGIQGCEIDQSPERLSDRCRNERQRIEHQSSEGRIRKVEMRTRRQANLVETVAKEVLCTVQVDGEVNLAAEREEQAT